MQSDRQMTDSAIIIYPNIQSDYMHAINQLHPHFWKGDESSGGGAGGSFTINNNNDNDDGG